MKLFSLKNLVICLIFANIIFSVKSEKKWSFSKILGSNNHEMKDAATLKSLAKTAGTITLAKDEIRFYSSEASSMKASIKSFAEDTDPDFLGIHYGSFSKCSVSIDGTDSKFVVLPLISLISNKAYFLRVALPQNKDNNLDDFKNEFKEKCTQVKDNLKTVLRSYEEALRKSVSANQAIINKEAKAVANALSQVVVGSESQNKENNDKLDKITKELKTLEKEISSKKVQSTQYQKNKSISETNAKLQKQTTEELKAQLLKAQKEIQNKEKAMKELMDRKKETSLSKEDLEKDLKTIEQISQQRIQASKLNAKYNQLNQSVQALSQEAQEKAEKENSYKHSLEESKRKQEESKSLEKKAKDTKESYKRNLDIINKEMMATHESLKLERNKKANTAQEIKVLLQQHDETLESKIAITLSQKEYKKSIKKESIDILNQIGKCFDFRLGIIDLAKTSFFSDTKDAINVIKSLVPNQGDYNLIDKIYSSTVSSVCSQFTQDLKNEKKENKKKLRMADKIKRENIKRREGKTGLNGLIYSNNNVPLNNLKNKKK